MEKIESYVEYVKNFIADKLPEYEGTEVYGCDLGYTITEGINADGSATYNRQIAMDYIKEWFEEAAEVYRYQVENYGQAMKLTKDAASHRAIAGQQDKINSLLRKITGTQA